MLHLTNGQGTFPSMIIPKNINDVTKRMADGETLFDALQSLRIDTIEFFRHLETNQEDKNQFELARQIGVERMVDCISNDIDSAVDKFELDKAIAKTRASQWLAEKIIPKTYGQKLEVNNNVTIDIRGVLALANARVESITTQRTPEPKQIENAEEDLIG